MNTLATRHTAALTTLFETANQIAKQDRRFWTGYSGETVTGDQVARHLEATAALLDKHGWSRTYELNIQSSIPRPEFPDFDDVEKLTLKAIILRLLKFARDLYVHETSYTVSQRLTLSRALCDADDGVHGDADTRRAAENALDALLKANSGANYARFDSWASKVGRTQEEVLLLIETGAAFARQYGPGTRPTFLAA